MYFAKIRLMRTQADKISIGIVNLDAVIRDDQSLSQVSDSQGQSQHQGELLVFSLF